MYIVLALYVYREMYVYTVMVAMLAHTVCILCKTSGQPSDEAFADSHRVILPVAFICTLLSFEGRRIVRFKRGQCS